MAPAEPERCKHCGRETTTQEGFCQDCYLDHFCRGMDMFACCTNCLYPG